MAVMVEPGGGTMEERAGSRIPEGLFVLPPPLLLSCSFPPGFLLFVALGCATMGGAARPRVGCRVG